MTSYPPPIESPPSSADDDHLRTLSICHYVLAGLTALGCCGYGVFSIVMASVMPAMIETLPQPPAGSGSPPPPAAFFEMFGAFYLVFGVIQIVIGIAYGIGYFLAGRALAERRNLTLCYVVAGFACASVPLGTVLGVFTFIVLGRPSVKAQFEAARKADLHGIRT